jgi:hypothetical protein
MRNGTRRPEPEQIRQNERQNTLDVLLKQKAKALGFQWWARKGSKTIVISMPYADDGTVFIPSGTAKTKKLSHRCGRILITARLPRLDGPAISRFCTPPGSGRTLDIGPSRLPRLWEIPPCPSSGAGLQLGLEVFRAKANLPTGAGHETFAA